MVSKEKIPVYHNCAIDRNSVDTQEIMIQPFADYLKTHYNTLHYPHRHSFYHIVLFYAGTGTHTIDFIKFPVRPYQLYFMIPGQVHSWQFNDDVDGYVINFSENFLASFLLNSQYLGQFSFLRGISEQCVVNLPADHQKGIRQLFERMDKEAQHSHDENSFDMIRLTLLELFITTGRLEHPGQHSGTNSKKLILQHFLKLVEKDYKTITLPKHYASLLFVTPNYLNALCNQELGKPAGEVIRDRVLLEAKRLLTNLDLTIREIAFQLNFTDNSYFNRFFKKAVGQTPESFRKSFNQ